MGKQVFVSARVPVRVSLETRPKQCWLLLSQVPDGWKRYLGEYHAALTRLVAIVVIHAYGTGSSLTTALKTEKRSACLLGSDFNDLLIHQWMDGEHSSLMQQPSLLPCLCSSWKIIRVRINKHVKPAQRTSLMRELMGTKLLKPVKDSVNRSPVQEGRQGACKTCAVEVLAFQKAVKRHKLHIWS